MKSEQELLQRIKAMTDGQFLMGCLMGLDLYNEPTGACCDEFRKIEAECEAEIQSLKTGKSDHYRNVEEFKRLSGATVPDGPTEPDEHHRCLYAKLLLEETLETIKALGVRMRLRDDFASLRDTDQIEFIANKEFDLPGVVDGCVDTKYVATFILVSCGVPDVPFVEMVDANNLAKFGPGAWKDETGKVRKPPGHKPPPIAEKLAELGWVP